MPADPTPERLHFVDALRAIAVALLIVFHTGLIFTPFFNYVLVNREGSMVIALFAVAFLHMWHMPLFFFLAGMTAWFSLGRRTPGRYAAERVVRIFLPFVFGFFLLIPPQVYWDRVSRGRFDGSYVEFIPLYFTEGFTHGYVSWHHLWFILYLFVLSMVALPALLWLRRGVGARVKDSLAGALSRRGVIFLAPLLVLPTEILFRGRYPGGFYNLVTDWANVTLFLGYLLLGYLAASDRRILDAIRRQWKTALALGVMLSAGLLALVWQAQDWPRFGYDDPRYTLYVTAGALNTWLWVMAWAGFGMAFLNRRTRWLDYAGEVSYPYYILHHTVLIGIGFTVIQTPLPVFAKFLLIAVSAFFLTALGVEIVKLTPVTRFMVGLRPRRRPAPPGE
jgi:peptidoglycan/LPS O-acetylase OafA/YrhL